MSVVMTNTAKQLHINVKFTGTTSVQTKQDCRHQSLLEQSNEWDLETDRQTASKI